MAIRRRVKITGNGDPLGTRVIDVETGDDLPVNEVSYRHAGQEFPTVELTVIAPLLDFEGMADLRFEDVEGNELELVPKRERGENSGEASSIHNQ